MKKLLKRFIKLIVAIFNKRSVIPFKPELDKAIENKIEAHEKIATDTIAFYEAVLQSYLKTYFGKQYTSQAEMAIAYSACDKKWRKLARKVNSTNKFITLNKDAFKNQCVTIVNNLTKSKTNGTNNK